MGQWGRRDPGGGFGRFARRRNVTPARREPVEPLPGYAERRREDSATVRAWSHRAALFRPGWGAPALLFPEGDAEADDGMRGALGAVTVLPSRPLQPRSRPGRARQRFPRRAGNLP